MKKRKVIVLYSPKDKYMAKLIVNDLGKLGIDALHRELAASVGRDIMENVRDGQGASVFFAVILTQNVDSSRWFTEGLFHGKQEETVGEGKPKILPLLFEPCEIPDISEIKCADFTDSYNNGFDSFADLLGYYPYPAGRSPLDRSFWGRVDFVFRNAEPPSEKTIIEALNEKAREMLRFAERSLYYSLRYNVLLSDYERTDASRFSADRYAYGQIDTFIFDYAVYMVWTAFARVVEQLNQSGKDTGPRDIVDAFHAKLRKSIYSRYDWIKHETSILFEINDAITLLLGAGP